ncbi:hypothetical protein PPACK8108_LOCUS1517 [Phakopsora pachyrhizi]|uniref:Septin-type G domain-containing protein n=1 Tax=Phakopsora pachyrhizi TaxID=170000 RepID=A0AAV0AJQ1_PHAPC|nr:hypothetical protein PPACK8108_LOCUS1517 [Phakopsora pachyrhizi]
MKKLSKVVNVVPVIAKSDGLTLEERKPFKVRIINILLLLNLFSVSATVNTIGVIGQVFFWLGQAVACTEAGHKAMKPNGKFDSPNDPGVQSVQKIYRYYKQEGYKTIVMGASFQNISSPFEGPVFSSL